MTLLVDFEEIAKIEPTNQTLYKYIKHPTSDLRNIDFEIFPGAEGIVDITYLSSAKMYFLVGTLEGISGVYWTRNLADTPYTRITSYEFGSDIRAIDSEGDNILVVERNKVSISHDKGYKWNTVTLTNTEIPVLRGVLYPLNTMYKIILAIQSGEYYLYEYYEGDNPRLVTPSITIPSMKLKKAFFENNSNCITVSLAADSYNLLYRINNDNTFNVFNSQQHVNLDNPMSVKFIDFYPYFNEDGYPYIKILLLQQSSGLYFKIDLNALWTYIEAVNVGEEVALPGENTVLRAMGYLENCEHMNTPVEIITNGEYFTTSSSYRKITDGVVSDDIAVVTLPNNKFGIIENSRLLLSYPIALVGSAQSTGLTTDLLFKDGDIESNIQIQGKADASNSINIGSSTDTEENNIRIGKTSMTKINLGALEIEITDEKLILKTGSEEDEKAFEFVWNAKNVGPS
jgi:hypothetical protein